MSINFERLQFWLSRGSHVSRPVEDLLGLAGFFPIHPRTYVKAWKRRKAAKERAATQNISENQTETSAN